MCIALYLKSQVFVSFPDSNQPMHCTINTYLRCGSYVVWACTKYWFRFYNQISNMPNIKYCLKSKCYSSRTRMTVAQCPNMDRTVKLIDNNWDLRVEYGYTLYASDQAIFVWKIHSSDLLSSKWRYLLLKWSLMECLWSSGGEGSPST